MVDQPKDINKAENYLEYPFYNEQCQKLYWLFEWKDFFQQDNLIMKILNLWNNLSSNCSKNHLGAILDNHWSMIPKYSSIQIHPFTLFFRSNYVFFHYHVRYVYD